MELDLAAYVITTEVPEMGRSHADVARAAVEGGATVVQFRDKRLPEAGALAAAREVRAVCADAGVPFVVNDDAGSATALAAEGLHVGRQDLDELDRWDPSWDAVVGISAATVEEALDGERRGADYLGVGPVFETPSKDDAVAPIGLEGLRAIVRAVGVPVVAIGGVTLENAASLVEAGARGVCVISAVAGASDPAAATAALLERVRAAGSGGERA